MTIHRMSSLEGPPASLVKVQMSGGKELLIEAFANDLTSVCALFDAITEPKLLGHESR